MLVIQVGKGASKAALHKDLVLLMKEYARTGYQQTQGGRRGEFEMFWGETFHLTESESVSSAEQQQYSVIPEPALKRAFASYSRNLKRW